MTKARLMLGACLVVAALQGCGRTAPAPPPAPAPELQGGLTWLNSSALTLADLRGRVVLLDFFEYSCVNCIRTFPYLQEWQRRYGDQGLVIIGVHTPQYGFSMDPLNVYAGTKLLGLTHPIVVDSDFKIADAYHNKYWPRKVLVDRAGRVRFDHVGEGAYELTERMIQDLLRETGHGREWPTPMKPVRDVDVPGVATYPITPELYAGSIRGRLGNAPEVVTNAPPLWKVPATIEPDRLYAAGEWGNHSEYLRHLRDAPEMTDHVLVRYRASEVNAVLKPEEIYWLMVLVQQDGQWIPRDRAGADVRYDESGRSYLKVDMPRMYNVIAQQPHGEHELRLFSRSRGLSVYSFSFGTSVVPPGVANLRTGTAPR